MKKIILKTLIGTFITSAILGIFIIFFGLWNVLTGKILLSTAIIFGFSIPGLACAAIYEKEKYKLFSTIGMLTCFISCICFLLLAWEILRETLFFSWFWKFMCSGLLLSASFGHICLLLTIDSNDKMVNCFKFETIGLSLFMDLLLLLQIFIRIEFGWKSLSIITILIVLGTIVTPLWNKLNNKSQIKKQNITDDKYKKIEQIKILLDSNAITKEEYENEKNKILNS